MTSRDFCYWLQGFFELREHEGGGPRGLSPQAANDIKAHLAMVFLHEIDPSAGPPAHQKKLNTEHEKGKATEVEKPRTTPDPFCPHHTLIRC